MKSSIALTLMFAVTPAVAATACIEEGYDPLRGEPTAVLLQGAQDLPATILGRPRDSDIDESQWLLDRGPGFQRPLH